MASESIDSYRDLDVQNKTVLGENPGGAGAWGLVGLRWWMENQAQERKNRLALAHEGSEGDGRWMGWLGYGITIPYPG